MTVKMSAIESFRKKNPDEVRVCLVLSGNGLSDKEEDAAEVLKQFIEDNEYSTGDRVPKSVGFRIRPATEEELKGSGS